MVAADHLEVAEAAGAHEVESGLVAEQDVEFGVGSGVGETHGKAIEGADRLVTALHVQLEGFHFGGGHAAEAPVGGDHLLDDIQLDFIDGLVAGDVGLVHVAEGFGVFVGQQQCGGEDAVIDRVLGRPGLAFGSFGAAGLGAIGAARGSAFFRDLKQCDWWMAREHFAPARVEGETHAARERAVRDTGGTSPPAGIVASGCKFSGGKLLVLWGKWC